MLRVDEGEEEFFDSVDYFPSAERFGVKEKDLGYEIWLNEPQSVKERRMRFLTEMGLSEFDRITQCSGAVCGSSETVDEKSLSCEGRDSNGNNSTFVVDEFDEQCFPVLPVDLEGGALAADKAVEHPSVKEETHVCECDKFDVAKMKMRRWWKHFARLVRNSKINTSNVRNVSDERSKFRKVKVQRNRKHYMELSALYARQEIRAHKGKIGTMKFSPDGHFLASGGEDGIVRIWRVNLVCASYNTTDFTLHTQGKSSSKTKRYAPIVLPDKVLHIDETPVQEFHGHKSDVLDLAWSSSNLLLSSSKDQTVRLWRVGSDKCLDVFKHCNFVTCIQFNPVDENYFISGSIDGKVRIWGVQERRVVNWADVHDLVTALCYQPNAKGFVVGSLSGTCRFYDVLDNDLLLNAELPTLGRKKSSGNRITGIKFLEHDPQRVMITSEDSKIRILDGLEVVHKFKGLAKSGSQMSASFTSTGRHIVSVGEDSRIYMWNHDEIKICSSKQAKSVRSFERFFSDGVSVAIPWSGTVKEQKNSDRTTIGSCIQKHDYQEVSPWLRDSEHFSLTNWFSTDSSFRSSATWPEERLPALGIPFNELGYQPYNAGDHFRLLPTTCGLVIVAASLDGSIRTFQNCGLPVTI